MCSDQLINQQIEKEPTTEEPILKEKEDDELEQQLKSESNKQQQQQDEHLADNINMPLREEPNNELALEYGYKDLTESSSNNYHSNVNPKTLQQQTHEHSNGEDFHKIIREDYLKSKIKNMNIHNSISSAIIKGINKSLFDSKRNFTTNHLNNVTIAKQNALFQNDNNQSNSYSNSNPSRMRLIAELKTNESQLNKQIHRLTQNQNVLESSSYINLAFPYSKANVVNDTVRLFKINNIKKQKETLINRQIELSNIIKALANEEQKQNGKHNQSIKNTIEEFQTNFDKSKEAIVKQIKLFHKESFLRQQKIANDVERNLLMRTNQLEMKEKENEQKKMVYIQQLRQQERDAIVKRQKNNNVITGALRKLSIKTTNNGNSSKSYSYIDFSTKYFEKESNYIRDNINKRKAYMKVIDSEDLLNFSTQMQLANERREEDQYEKAQKLQQLWLERNRLKPEYVSPLANKFEEKQAKDNEIIEEKKLLLEKYRKNRIKYSNSVIKPRIIIKEIDKQKKEEKKAPLQLSRLSQLSQSSKVKVIKPKAMTLTKSQDNNKETALASVSVSQVNQIDYLLEKRRNRSTPKERDWNDEFKKETEKTSFVESLLNIKSKSSIMDEKIKRKKQLMQVNNNRIGSNPQFCEEMSTLMINAIKAKLSILNNTVKLKEEFSKI